MMSEKSEKYRQGNYSSLSPSRGKPWPRAESSPLPSVLTRSFLQFLASLSSSLGWCQGLHIAQIRVLSQCWPLDGDGLTQMKPQMCVQASSPQIAMQIWTPELRQSQSLNADRGETEERCCYEIFLDERHQHSCAYLPYLKHELNAIKKKNPQA